MYPDTMEQGLIIITIIIIIITTTTTTTTATTTTTIICTLTQWILELSVTVETRVRDGRPGFKSRRGQQWDFSLFAIASRLALGPTQTPVQWLPWSLSPG
jgi:hypothetical protein